MLGENDGRVEGHMDMNYPLCFCAWFPCGVAALCLLLLLCVFVLCVLFCFFFAVVVVVVG